MTDLVRLLFCQLGAGNAIANITHALHNGLVCVGLVAIQAEPVSQSLIELVWGVKLDDCIQSLAICHQLHFLRGPEET